MTNEERAREAAEQIGFVLDEDAAEAIPIILAALDAATAPLVAERERLTARQRRLDALLRDAEQAIDVCLNMVEGDGDIPDWGGLRTVRSFIRSALAEKEPG